MIYIFLSILCSSSIAIILKTSENKKFDRYIVTSANYVTAFIISILLSDYSTIDLNINSIGSFFSEVIEVIAGGVKFSDDSMLGWSLFLGVLSGICYFLGFIYIQKSLKVSGVGITGAFSKLGILVPMFLALFFWKEYPTAIQTTGIIIAFAAIILANIQLKNSNLEKAFNPVLLTMFVFVGVAEFGNKMFEKYGNVDYKAIYLFTVFFTAFLVSLIFSIPRFKKVGLRKNDILTGLLVGIPNMFTSYFLIMSFKYYKTTVVFPIYSAGSILVMTLAGYLIFKEILKKREIFAIVLTVISLILLNIK